MKRSDKLRSERSARLPYYTIAFTQFPACLLMVPLFYYLGIRLDIIGLSIVPLSCLAFTVQYARLTLWLWEAVQCQFTRITPWMAVFASFNPLNHYDPFEEWGKIYNLLAKRADPPVKPFPLRYRRGNGLTIALLLLFPPFGVADFTFRSISFMSAAIRAVRRLNASAVNRYYNVNLYSAQMEEDGWGKKLSIAEYYKQRRKEKAEQTAEQPPPSLNPTNGDLCRESHIMKPIDLLTKYKALLAEFGHQHWWPLTAGRWQGKRFRPSRNAPRPKDYSPHFEVIAGTILTQNTAWRNVEPSIRNLFDAETLEPERLVEMDDAALRAAIRSSGYFNQKADRLKRIAQYIIDEFSGDAAAMASQIERDALLALNGVGHETADSILLYAGFRPFFVIDAYTRRWLQSFNIEFKNYEDYRLYFEDNLPRNVALYNEFHALIVRLQGRQYSGRLVAKRNKNSDLKQ